MKKQWKKDLGKPEIEHHKIEEASPFNFYHGTHEERISGKGSVCGAAPICCTYERGGFNPYFIRATGWRCRAYRSFVNLNESLPVSEWPEPAVEIQLVPPPEPPCSRQADCDINSSCWAARKGISRCFCEHKFHWDPVAGICASNATSILHLQQM